MVGGKNIKPALREGTTKKKKGVFSLYNTDQSIIRYILKEVHIFILNSVTELSTNTKIC